MATSIVSNNGDTPANFKNSPQKTGEPLDHAKLFSGKALEFDGVTDYLDTGYNAYTNSLEGSDLTLSCWLKYGSITNNSTTIWGTSTYNTNRGFAIKGKSSTTIAAGIGDGSNFVDVAFTFTTGKWHFAVATFTQSDLKVRFYVDGVLIGTSSALSGNIEFDQSWTAAEEFVMGARFTSVPANYWNGALSNCQLWNKVWSLDDAKYAYENPEKLITDNTSVTAGITTSNLLLWYPMNDTGDRTVTDSDMAQTVIFDAAGTNITTKNHASTVFTGDELIASDAADNRTFDNDAGNWAALDTSGADVVVDTTSNKLRVTTTTDNEKEGAQLPIVHVGNASATSIVAGRAYRVSMDIQLTTPGSGTITTSISLGGKLITPFSITTTETTYEKDVIPTNNTGALEVYNKSSTATVFTIDNVSVKELGIASGWTDVSAADTIPQRSLINGSFMQTFPTVNTDYISMDDPTFTDDDIHSVFLWVMPYRLTSSTVAASRFALFDTTSPSWILSIIDNDLRWTKSGSADYDNTQNNITEQKWYLVGFTRSGTGSNNTKFYINDSTAGTTVTPVAMNWSTIRLFHCNSADRAAPIIAEFMIFDKQLSDAEVAELYNSGVPMDARDHSTSPSTGTDYLIGYWRNNHLTSAGAWEDLSTNNNHGTITGNSENIFFQQGLTANKDSQGFAINVDHTGSSGAVHFDGVSDYIDLGYTTTIEGEFALEFWLKTDKVDSNGNITTNTIMGTGADDKLIITDHNTLTLEMAGTDKAIDIDDVGNHATDTLLVNEWVHIVIVRESDTELKLYVNSQIQNDAAETSTAGFDYRYIGFDGESTYFKGWLDEFRVYDKELTAAQVLNNYNVSKNDHSNS